MTQDEIIDMAIQAGASPDENKIWLMYAEEIETFANLVAAKEREACAQVCVSFQARDVGMQPADCAGAIRARGKA